ncbi:lipase family protein [Chitinophaga oryzae]|uniref:Lipase family protein n=1 Tax=Chitinophaga oryzae TaxID=2725414 RepID=A0AAE6ZHD5_9BACT|nr:lipase family protein [Chitinophaga oryzae]QJB31809.1 lipase family protein [Chitinophaga oryzae]
MINTTSAPLTDAQTCIILASMAYATMPSDVPLLMSAASQQYPGWNWEALWCAQYNGNLAFLALDETSNRVAISVRGTVMDPWDFWEDFDVFNTVPWGDGYVAQGAFDGLLNLLKATDSNGLTLFDALQFQLRSIQPPQLLVTGHSLGGALASILAMQLKDAVPPSINWAIYTFASPTVGDSNFQQLYNDTFTGPSCAYRYYNTSDLIPCAYESLASVIGDNIPVATSFIAHAILEAATKFIDDKLQNDGLSYVQVGTAVPLGPPPPAPNEKIPASSFSELRAWTAYEHSHITYLSLLGLSPVLPSPAVTTAAVLDK